jgi:predicted DCC family thiol-disulfide oxidoreductase YuxK
MFSDISLVYDGHCGFCRRCLRFVQRLDVAHVLHAYDAHDEATVQTRFPMLRGADLLDAIYAVDDRGHTYRGFFAFRRLIWGSPLMWPLLPIFYFPGATLIGPRVYAWVARNRHSLGCETDVCDVPPAPGPPK